MQPMVVNDITEDAPLMAEEQFCPAVPVATYRDVGDAIARANAIMYGFDGSIWSKNIARASEASRVEHVTMLTMATPDGLEVSFGLTDDALSSTGSN